MKVGVAVGVAVSVGIWAAVDGGVDVSVLVPADVGLGLGLSVAVGDGVGGTATRFGRLHAIEVEARRRATRTRVRHLSPIISTPPGVETGQGTRSGA